MNLINTRNATATAITAGSVIPVGSIVHKSGSAITSNGTGFQINGSGYFKITANASITASAVGNQTLSMNVNGQPIAVATETVSTAGGDANLTAIGTVYNRCGCASNMINFTAGADGEITEIDVIIERM